MKRLLNSAAILMLAATVAACNVQSPTAPSSRSDFGITVAPFQAVFAGELSSRDRSLVATVARVLELHIQLGQHAHNSGDLADVKKLALEMRETYSSARAALQETAGPSQYPSGLNLSPQQTVWRDQVAAVTGSQLDAAYLEVTIAALEADIAALDTGADSPILNELIADIRGRMMRHLTEARGLTTRL